ncbi:MAG: nucleotide exchange factor GrpE [Bryobacterales bacterium]|nr:nucleotide exchange factor GrpE [Bryobacterales bacterium]
MSKKPPVADDPAVEEQSVEEQNPDSAPETAGADSDWEPPGTEAALTAERDQWAAEKAELQDRFLRAQAEFQNSRKRAEKERLEFAEYASTEAVRALLPVLDDFERALKAESADREFQKGMELIHQRLYESLKKLGLQPLESVGQPFDPHAHHAVEMVETDAAADHTILDEYQRGYNFKARLLRPAMVKVAVAPASQERDGSE